MDAEQWYDGWWWREHARVRRWLAEHEPDRLGEFVEAFEALRVPASFEPLVLQDAVSPAERRDMVEAIAAIDPVQLEAHELDSFGRHTVHDFFADFRGRAQEIVEGSVGMDLEPSYDFLSLYRDVGVCETHLDAPNAMWTLDIVLDQSALWPLHVSRVVPWPSDTDGATHVPALDDLAMSWQSIDLDVGEAVVFGGSNQWHGREPMPTQTPPGWAHLVFFHFIPAGTADLVNPDHWPELFDLPELAMLDASAQVAESRAEA